MCAPDAEDIQRCGLLLSWLGVLILLVLLISSWEVIPLLLLLILGLWPALSGVPGPGDVPTLH